MSVEPPNRSAPLGGLHGPPSTPQPLPAVLEGFDLTDQSRFSNGFPHQVFARLRRDAPVLFHPPGQSIDGDGFWVLSKHADIREAAANPAFSSRGGGGRPHGGTHIDDARPELPGVLFNMMDDPRHQDFKDVMTPAMGRQALATLEGKLRPYAAELVSSLLARGNCDFATEVGATVGAHAISQLLGIPSQDWPLFAEWTSLLMGFDDREAGRPTERSQKIHMDIFRYGCQLLAAKRAGPSDDLTSLLAGGKLASTSGEGPISDLERQTCFCLMVLAGTESTRNMIAGGVLALAENPEQWRALRADRSLVPSAVEEILRWTSPTPYNRRTATRDIRIRDTQIRAGDKVTLWWTSANRDEDVFSNPFSFDIRRKPNPHLAFGYGSHTCFGDHLGRLEMRVVLEALLDRVEQIELTGQVAWAGSNKHTVLLRMPVALTGA
ncbi:cytochrome P450 [Stigmatella aurantiaca]|uniref:P450 heme-thiolate protein n=1 Tax=Stigmatella aurantiaca (strain DW4/3-1) TaxID=378806 RepID=Q090E2_STIAD|nr:cytochrome P450 [Stigmatella aurantiaca]ADO72986.1 P450 heme-thiolate protein [Stigmatella aurantiaca DW4/3-1]EAU66104.1 P450 heme-thiolate protein [Stigmatella aurantiaca DW4/3-1]